MQLSFAVQEQELLVAFLLAMTRAATWLLISPPFSNRGVPRQVRVGFAAALALVSAPELARQSIPLDAPGLMGASLAQVFIGGAIGFTTMLLFSAIQAAGSLIDFLGGFEMAQLLDPMSGAGASVFGRFYQLIATAVLFAIDGHVIITRAFLMSFRAVPFTEMSTEAVSVIGIEALGRLMVSAMQIAAPLLAALFIAEIGVGLLSRAAPQMNAMVLGMNVKALATMSLVGLSLIAIPGAVSGALRESVRAGQAVLGG
jgi:flagellar biosynthesis protein FliR